MFTFSGPGWSSQVPVGFALLYMYIIVAVDRELEAYVSFFQVCGMDIELTGCIDNDWEAAWMGYPPEVTPITGTNYPLPCVFQYLKGKHSSELVTHTRTCLYRKRYCICMT